MQKKKVRHVLVDALTIILESLAEKLLDLWISLSYNFFLLFFKAFPAVYGDLTVLNYYSAILHAEKETKWDIHIANFSCNGVFGARHQTQ